MNNLETLAGSQAIVRSKSAHFKYLTAADAAVEANAILQVSKTKQAFFVDTKPETKISSSNGSSSMIVPLALSVACFALAYFAFFAT